VQLKKIKKMKNINYLKWNALYFKLILTILFVWMIGYTGSANVGTLDTLTYFSTTQSSSCNLIIYLPAGYTEVGDTNHYPVLYLMHGGGEDYTFWTGTPGRADTVLNYYISHGIAVPMILVTPDGRNLSPEIFSNEMFNDIIPLIESNYRVKADKDHRGIGGLSWGGSQTLELGILHYDMFGYIASMSSGFFSQAKMDEADAFLDTNDIDLEKSLRYFYFAEGTKYDITYDIGMQSLAIFRNHGLTVHYWEYSGGHQWSVWKEDFKSFVPYLFRDTTTRYISLEFMGGVIKNSTIMTCRDSLATAPEDPTRYGYSFAGWYTEPEYIDSFNFSMDTIKSNITLYANWSPNSYTVSFNSNGGNYTPDAIVAVYNTRIEAPVEPTKEGLFFEGWYSDTLYEFKWDFAINRVTKDIALLAKWGDGTSIPDDQKSSIVVFPNPAQSYLQIGNLQSEACVDIFSIDGNLLIHKDKIDSNGLINIESIPQGIYTIVINCANENYHFKFIKQ
jgi:uncharacterized repeat protein (TIGR02543 family)